MSAIIAVAATAFAGLVAASVPASAAGDPSSVSFTLAGCRNNGSISLPISGKFVCPTAAYTTGNLGKGWNELDLVPVRVTASAGTSAPASQTYSFDVAVDNCDGTDGATGCTAAGDRPGYDVLSSDGPGGTPVLNTSLSSGTCGTVTASSPQYAVIGGGTALYRTLTVTGQARSATCVYDLYARLALGSHLWSGSSLHFNLYNQNLGSAGIGSKEVSIPVNEIRPQSLSKTMGATRDTAFAWLLEKNADPLNLPFTDTCDTSAATLTAQVAITLSWTQQPGNASGYTVTTVVTATNPASRTITVDATDHIYSGGTTDTTTGVHSGGTPLSTLDGGPIAVPGGSSVTAVSQVLNVNPSTLSDPDNPDFNDVATATYTDAVTGVAVPGNTFAYASVANNAIGSGATNGDSIVVNDTESITGTGLDFSVAAPATGSFTGGYTAGHYATSVGWTSGTQTTSGSVVFTKTVRVTSATVTSGTLSDTASDGVNAGTASASAHTDITADATTSLSVSKSMSLNFTSSKTFTFHLFDGADTDLNQTATATIPAGSSGPVASSAITGLSPTGTYYFKEDATAPFPSLSTGSHTFALTAGDTSTCSFAIPVTNRAAPATAQVSKDTLPASGGDWTFTLTGPGSLSEPLTNVTEGTGYHAFGTALDVDGGVYTITETQQAGYDLTGLSGDLSSNTARVTPDIASRSCSFTLNLSTDSGKTFECAFTNTQRGALKVHKTVVKNDAGNTLTDSFTICVTGPSYAAPTLANGGCQTIGIDGGDLTWSSILPGSYTVSEVNPGTPWIVGISPTTVTVNPGATATTALSTVTNTRRGRAQVLKTVSNHDGSGTAAPSGTDAFTFTLRSGATNIIGHPGTVLETQVANAANGGNIPFTTLLTPGQHYQICETLVGVGWSSSLPSQFVPEQYLADGVTLNPSVINNVVCSDFVAVPGPDPTVFRVDNRRPPGGTGFTIGYWKNWASCTKSALKTKNALDQTLYLFGSGGLVVSATSGGYPGFGPTYYLRLFAGSNPNQSTDCTKAVALLNKSTFTGKKMASDPAFNLAAQLVAAELNYKGGAATSVTNQINQAVLLLGKYQFNGNTHTTISAADAATMNSLAHTLDLYNNGLI